MPSLRESYVALQAAIVAPEDPAWNGDPVRLGVYRNAYWSRLAGVLRVNYPVLAKMLDEDESPTTTRRNIPRRATRSAGTDVISIA